MTVTPQTPAPTVRTAPAVGAGPKLGPQHTMALHAIHDGAVVCHPVGSHHVPGWGWVEGGDMSLSVQAVVNDLHTHRLLVVDTSGRFHVDGDPVGLTEAGRIVLDRIGGAS
jgi:hypothetical protein